MLAQARKLGQDLPLAKLNAEILRSLRPQRRRRPRQQRGDQRDPPARRAGVGSRAHRRSRIAPLCGWIGAIRLTPIAPYRARSRAGSRRAISAARMSATAASKAARSMASAATISQPSACRRARQSTSSLVGEAALRARGGRNRVADELARVRRPAVEARAIDEHEGHAEEVRGHADVPVRAMQPEIERVGQRVFLRVDGTRGDRGRHVLHVDGDRLEAQRAKHLLVQRVVQGADFHALAVARVADRAQAVGEVAEAVVPERQHAKAGCAADVVGEAVAEIAVQRPVGALTVGDEKRQVQHAQRRDAAGEIARAEIAQVEIAALHQGQQVARLASLTR